MRMTDGRTFDIEDNYEWFEDQGNLVRLFVWMGENGKINERFSDIAYFFSKPWKFRKEWDEFQAEEKGVTL